MQVLFKKVIGEASYGQVSLFFSLIGLFNAALLWPVCLVLYFTRVETLHWEQLPWPVLLAASGLSLGITNLLHHLIIHTFTTLYSPHSSSSPPFFFIAFVRAVASTTTAFHHIPLKCLLLPDNMTFLLSSQHQTHSFVLVSLHIFSYQAL